jgi:hypothetical protein
MRSQWARGRLRIQAARGVNLRLGHSCGLRRRKVRAELVVEPVGRDEEVGRSVAAWNWSQRLAKRAAWEHAHERERRRAVAGANPLM